MKRRTVRRNIVLFLCAVGPVLFGASGALSGSTGEPFLLAAIDLGPEPRVVSTPGPAERTEKESAAPAVSVTEDRIVVQDVPAPETPPVETSGEPPAASSPGSGTPAAAAEAASKESAAKKAAQPAAPRRMEVVGDRLNVRARPGLRYEIVGQVVRGDVVEVLEEKDGWGRIRPPKGFTVWIHGAFLRDGEVIGDRVNLRAGPSLSYSIVGRVRRGTPIREKSRYKEWVEIDPVADASFWVSMQYLRPAPRAAGGETTVIETFTPPAPEGTETVVIHGGAAAGKPASPETVVKASPPPDATTPETRAPAAGEKPPAGETTAPAAGPVAPKGEGEVVRARPVEETVAGEPSAAAEEAKPAEEVSPAESAEAGESAEEESVAAAEAGETAPPQEGARIPPARPDTAPLVIPESKLEWLGPAKDVVVEGEILRTGFLIRRPGTHKLITRNGRRVHLLGYLRSDEVRLDPYVGKQVRIVGSEQWAKGWPRPVIHVRQVSLVR